MVATDWTPIIQTSIGAVAALGGGLVGSWVQVTGQDRAQRNDRRTRAAEALAGVAMLLDDTAAKLTADWFIPPFEVTKPLFERRDQQRSQLLVLGAGHPSTQVWQLARQLDDAVLESIAALMAWIATRQEETGEDHEEARFFAVDKLARAQRLLQELHDAI